MKRQNYQIKLNGYLITVKHAWNSSIREIEGLVSMIANSNKQTYSLVESQSIKGDYGLINGYRIWQGNNGNELNFEISLIN